MRLNKQVFIIIALVMMFVGIVALMIIERRNDPSRTITKTDPDTGEVVINEPNKVPEKDNDTEEMFVLGSPEILRRGATQQQYELFRSTLLAQVQKHHGTTYDRVKIIRDDLWGDGNEVNGKVRLGESDTIWEFKLLMWELYNIQVTFHDPSGKTPDFDSGVLTAPSEYEEDEEVY